MKLNEELSYKQACAELNDKQVASGRCRDLQLIRWNRVAEVKKVGRGKYLIVRQFSPEEIQETEYTRNYSKFLQNMLVNMFAEGEGTVQTYTYRQLREYLNMVNRRYFPVKYGNEGVDIVTSRRINIGSNADDEIIQQIIACDEENQERDSELVAQEKFWFHQADSHDKDALHYALRVLRNRGLLVSFSFTYVFYKAVRNDDGVIIYNKPTIADSEQKAEIHQRIMDFLKDNLTKEQQQAIEEKVEAENAEDKEGRILGLYRKIVLGSSEELRKKYNEIPKKYAVEIGQDTYAKAVTIVRPTRLETLVDTFAPKFNKVQVEEYLRSKKFKKAELPESVHIQLTNQLIKI